jgi:hypothetical protein
LAVSLKSSSAAVVVPESVTVAAGATSAGFTAKASAVSTAETATLTARAGSASESYVLKLGAAVPGLKLSKSSVAFGDVTVKTAATETVTLTSSGTAALIIRAGAVTGTGFSATGMSYPVTLEPGKTASLSIKFDPTANGSASGTVKLTTNTSAGTAAIALSGTGGAATYEVDVSWNAPSDSTVPVAGYDVYRAVSGSSSYELLNASLDDATSYTDTTVQAGVEYNYYVVSVDASGNQSAPSNLFSVTIP